MIKPKNKSISLPWRQVEDKIDEEVQWLRDSLDFFHTTQREFKDISVQYGYCDGCILRKIAILIVSGKITALEIKRDQSLPSFWLKASPEKDSSITRSAVYHGDQWHSKLMANIESHFLGYGFNVLREPTLHWGRADLGVYKTGEKDLIIEVGTTSALKLFINLKKMKGAVFLIVPNDEKLIEFTT